MDNTYPTYQYSYFLENGAQVVIRGNVWTEFQSDLKLALDEFPVKRSNVVSKPTVEAQTPTLEMCPIHNIELKQRISKAGKPYTSHVRKIGEEWDRCFGKGWMSEKEGQSSEDIGRKLNENY
jgi:hypothetical protein